MCTVQNPYKLAKLKLTIEKTGPHFQLSIAASPSVTQDALSTPIH